MPGIFALMSLVSLSNTFQNAINALIFLSTFACGLYVQDGIEDCGTNALLSINN